MSDESGNLVPQRLGGDESHFFDDALVDVEVEGELGVVLLNDDPGGLLDGLGADATHLEIEFSTRKSEIGTTCAEIQPEKEVCRELC